MKLHSLLCTFVLATPAVAGRTALSVQIDDPVNGAVVSGLVTISGVSTDVGSGKVSVSIDGGPFQLASGTDAWTFPWDSSTVSDGLHSITARARLFPGGPQVTDTIQVSVDNGGSGGLGVTIVDPIDGDHVFDTFLLVGTSSAATEVTVSVDGGPELPTNGLLDWNVVFEPGSLSPGSRLLRARATDGVSEVFDTITVIVGDPPPGLQEFTYFSSVDQEPLTSKLWVPAGFDPNGPPVPLVIHLHGGGGKGSISTPMAAQLDARGWVGVSPDGRYWGLHDLGCGWETSAGYVDNPDPDVGPGERDILDAITWAQEHLPIDPDRIYLSGFSMGGRGTYMIGLKNPDLFAAIFPAGPAIDMFEIYVRRPEPRECKEGMVGGAPGDSPFVDTMYRVTSGRFLMENAYNLPVFHGHGWLDTVANNDPSHAPFLHGWHATSDAGWDGCFDDPNFCFGHTPVLAELEARHPDGYDWAFLFSEVSHQLDPRWLEGAPMGPEVVGVEDPNAPGNLIGAYDFFAARTRKHSPDTVVYKTYEDEHQRAYWLELLTATPWLDSPAAVRATRDELANSLDLELVRAAELRVDLPRAGLELSGDRFMTVVLSPLAEAVYDPALAATGEPLTPTLVLQGDLGGVVGLTVHLDGAPLDPTLVDLTGGELRLGPLEVFATHLLEIAVQERGCEGAPNSAGAGASVSMQGSSSVSANDLVLGVVGAIPNGFGLFFYGPEDVDLPFGDGHLCISGGLHRVKPNLQADGAGSAAVAVDLTQPPFDSGAGEVQVGTSLGFQYWYRDVDAGGAGFNSSDRVRVTFLP